MNLDELLKSTGYTEEEYNELKTSYTLKNFKNETLIIKINTNYNWLLEFGYSKKTIIKMTKSFPEIYNYPKETLKQKLEDIIELGYSKEEIIKMTKSHPTIYGLSIENIKKKIKDLIKLGYCKEEVIKMTKSLPEIYSLSIKNIKQKLEFYDSINMHELAIIDAKKIMQSVNLSYARYQFYKEENIEITISNYRILFLGQKVFEKRFGITKEELLKRYDYNSKQDNLLKK